jgi:hypothetical protein
MVGGTFGVAILGALVATLGRSKIDELLPRLPDAARGKLADGLGSGGVAHGVPARVTDAAQQAFVYALHYGLLLGAGVALLGAIAAFTLIRKRADEPHDAAELVEPVASGGPGRELAGGAASPHGTERVPEPVAAG